MLNTQPPVAETQTPPPTPQEIAQAIAAIEERKTSPASSQAVQTNTVSEVIDHLGLDMTADDILAEVQAQRALPKPLVSLPPSVRKRVAGITAVGALLLFGALFVASQPAPRPEPDPVVSAPAFMNYTPPPRRLALTPDILVADTAGSSPTLKTLGEIPDNHPVLCGLKSDGQTTTDQMDWTLIKHNGKVYLRCCTVPMSARAFAQAAASDELILFPGHGDTVYDAKATEPLTVLASALTLQQDAAADGSLHPLTLGLDSHAHEPWKP